MNLSYEDIGRWCATFACGGSVAEGSVVKVSAPGTAAPCTADENFCGAAVFVDRTGDACSVALSGLVTAAYTGTAPQAGYAALAADGSGGVKVAPGGRSHLVVDVDEGAKTVTFLL